MSFLTPLFLLLSLLAIPIIVLYMLKLRRKEVEISSTMLWQMVLRDRQANAPWQKLRRNLLLLLQLLILAGLVFALARPAIPVPAVATGSVIVLLDASASMQATDVQPSRFDAALDIVRGVIASLNPDSTMTLILVADQPEILIAGESDKALLTQALADAAPIQGTVNWQSALALAAGAAGRQTVEATTIIISDGGLPSEGLPPLPGQVKYVPIGESANNLAVSALALRPAAQGAELFARVTNYGDTDRLAILSISLDGTLYTAERLQIPANDSQSIVLENLPNTTNPTSTEVKPLRYEARLTTAEGSEAVDDFALDNVAFAIYTPPVNRNVLLVSEGNLFLEQLLSLVPNLTPFRVVPNADGQITIPDPPFGVYVFDGIIPGNLPPADVLMVNPPTNDLFTTGGITSTLTNPIVADNPLMQFVDWSNVHVSQAKQVTLPDWGRVLVNTDTTPLVFVGETGGRRIAVVTFDLHDSDLPLQVTFPILFSNLLNYLSPPNGFDAPNGLVPHQGITIQPEQGVEGIAIAAPNGQVYTPLLDNGSVFFQNTGELGLYAVNYLPADQYPAEYFAVNLFAPEESDIRPAADIRIGLAAVQPQQENELGNRELWNWLAALALVILLVEWWVYHRRQTAEGSSKGFLKGVQNVIARGGRKRPSS
ncbi:MAG: BatA domain-containing protein [Anaerolineales bacterium]|nr:BatA domain-containing protein [Anaerolineales bacterium]